MKLQLKKVVRTHVLTQEQFITVVTEVEGIFNRRPLIPLGLDNRPQIISLREDHSWLAIFTLPVFKLLSQFLQLFGNVGS